MAHRPPKEKTTKGETRDDLPLYGNQAIDQNLLERWPNPERIQSYRINFSFPEFTCLCPRSGYPDFATILIAYEPGEFIVELKSLKLYLNGYREKKVSHEGAINRIFRDLNELLKPKSLEVVGDFNVRGNLKTIVTVNSGMNSSSRSARKRS